MPLWPGPAPPGAPAGHRPLAPAGPGQAPRPGAGGGGLCVCGGGQWADPRGAPPRRGGPREGRSTLLLGLPPRVSAQVNAGVPALSDVSREATRCSAHWGWGPCASRGRPRHRWGLGPGPPLARAKGRQTAAFAVTCRAPLARPSPVCVPLVGRGGQGKTRPLTGRPSPCPSVSLAARGGAHPREAPGGPRPCRPLRPHPRPTPPGCKDPPPPRPAVASSRELQPVAREHGARRGHAPSAPGSPGHLPGPAPPQPGGLHSPVRFGGTSRGWAGGPAGHGESPAGPQTLGACAAGPAPAPPGPGAAGRAAKDSA